MRTLSPAADRLARALRGRVMGPFEKSLVAVLHDDIFLRTEDLRPSETCDLSYRRLRHFRRRLNVKIADVFPRADRLVMMHEWLALVDGTAATLMTIHYNLCIGTILEHRGDRVDALKPLLRELERMDAVGAFLATELAYGNNLQALETEAIYNHGTRSFVLQTPNVRALKFMPNTGAPGIAKLAVVMARLKVDECDHGVFPFVVRIRTERDLCPGVAVTPLGDKADYALDNAMTSFDAVRVPMEHWLSGSESRIDAGGRFTSDIPSARRRFYRSIDRVQTGKLCLGAAALSVTFAALHLTMNYSQQRRTFAPDREDVPIFRYRNQQRAIFESVAVAYAAAFLIRRAEETYRDRSPDREVLVNRWLAMSKVFTSSSAARIIALCRERIGAQGMFCANRIISYVNQVNGIVTAEGDNELLLARTGREMLFGAQYEPPMTQGPHKRDLGSIGFLRQLLHEHERRNREQLSASLGRAMSAGASRFDAWNDHITGVIELASVHAARLALDCFYDVLRGMDDPEATGVLEHLFRLFALGEIAKRSGSLLAAGSIDPDMVAWIEPERSRLCTELFGSAQEIIDAFGIPLGMLGAPIEQEYIGNYADRARNQRTSPTVGRSEGATAPTRPRPRAGAPAPPAEQVTL